jgi:phospholipid/cholesterol/gamma-HCH transport system substrate-binding protein
MKVSNEMKVGVLAAISITLLILGFNFMKGENIFSKENEFVAAYREVEGLLPSNPVLVNGFKVGNVTEVKMDNANLTLYVVFKVSDDIKVPRNSIAKIINKDMIGSKAMELIIGDSNVMARNGDTLSSGQDPGIAKSLSNILTPLTGKINSVLSGLESAMQGDRLAKAIDALIGTIDEFKSTASNLNGLMEDNSSKISSTMSHLEITSGDLKKASPKIDSIVSSVLRTSRQLEQLELKVTMEKINLAILELSTMLQKINKGEGSLGKLAKDQALYDNINSAAKQLDSLLKDIEKYPRRYTGLTEKQRKKGDKEKKKEN